ncbi:MAG: glycosyltransferase [Candidatus Thermoplasmatota archaeon]|nr:glycosyltransferase [Candidatus Thermoplasmatota archaeon]
MSVTTEITILTTSARKDYPLIGLPQTFLFQPTVESLNRQTYRDFEWVLVDANWSREREERLASKADFRLKYVNPNPNRFLERGLWANGSMKNAGIVKASGRLVIFLDDCTDLPPDWLEKMASWWDRGMYPMSLTYYYEGGHPKFVGDGASHEEFLYGRMLDHESKWRSFLEIGTVMRDSRAAEVEKNAAMLAPPSWFYGGSSVSLEALLAVNGMDERCDGQKGLDDVEVGMRVARAGFSRFLLKKELRHIEHRHESLDERVFFYRGPPLVCNFAIVQYNFHYEEPRVNEKIMTREDCELIRSKICPACQNYNRCKGEELAGRFYVTEEALDLWLSLQRTRNLRGERE